jgi:hypothetical protein
MALVAGAAARSAAGGTRVRALLVLSVLGGILEVEPAGNLVDIADAAAENVVACTLMPPIGEQKQSFWQSQL